MKALKIRYANPDSTPSKHGPNAGWIRPDVIITDDYWTIYGPIDALRRHAEVALKANDLNDCYWVEVA